MYQLHKGYNAITWTSDAQAISTTACLPVIAVVYVVNPITGVGYHTYQPGDSLSNMSVFAKGYNYLILATGDYPLTDAVVAPAGAFADFPGYVAPITDTAPIMPAGRTETGVAASPILGGRLVAQTVNGLQHYSSAIPEHHNLLFGIALNSALTGGSVSVRRPGYVHYDGWGLPIDTTLLAGTDGQLVTSLPATSFYHLIGRSLDADSLLYQPEIVVLLSTPKQLT